MESDFARNCLDAIVRHLRSLRDMLPMLEEIKAAILRAEERELCDPFVPQSTAARELTHDDIDAASKKVLLEACRQSDPSSQMINILKSIQQEVCDHESDPAQDEQGWYMKCRKCGFDNRQGK